MIVFQNFSMWSLVIVGSLFLSGGCTAVKENPVLTGSLIQSANDRELADRDRLKVLDELAWRPLQEHEREQLGKILAKLVGSNRHSPMIREKAIEIIVNRYPTDASLWLAKALVQTAQESLQRKMLRSLAELSDPQAIPYLILILPKNPQAGQTIEQISGQKLSHLLTEVLLNSQNPLNSRLASLEVLLRSQQKERTMAELFNRGGDDDDEFLEQLRFWSRPISMLPKNRLDYLQCSWQRKLLGDVQLAKIKSLAERINDEEGAAFSCQDSYLLLELAQSQTFARRDELVALIGQRLRSLDHVKRVARYRGASDDRVQDFDGQSEQLKYSDLIRIRWLLDALADDRCRKRLAQLIELDGNDKMSEVGGLCFRENQAVQFRHYEPARRVSDRRYLESPRMIQDSWFCLARWHCHVIDGQQGQLCGPGIDDLRLAQEKKTPMVIVSVVKKNCFNIDYVNAQGQVIDLGNY